MVIDKSLAQRRRRRTLVEKNFHLCCFKRASGRVLQYSTRLLDCDAWKPLDELLD